MSKNYYALRLIPSRPDFAMTMTAEEQSIMQQHVGYLTQQMEAGVALVFGPVMDPAGPYGLAIVAVDSEEQLQELIKNDPASTINRYEYHPMMAVVNEGLSA